MKKVKLTMNATFQTPHTEKMDTLILYVEGVMKQRNGNNIYLYDNLLTQDNRAQSVELEFGDDYLIKISKFKDFQEKLYLEKGQKFLVKYNGEFRTVVLSDIKKDLKDGLGKIDINYMVQYRNFMPVEAIYSLQIGEVK